jgi:FKBP-type peptidyl-prolyl cis-trans isomerase
LSKIGVGGKIKLYSPSPLAFGPTENTGIPANSIVTYEIELLEILP